MTLHPAIHQIIQPKRQGPGQEDLVVISGM
jgi:hypothetical protein